MNFMKKIFLISSIFLSLSCADFKNKKIKLKKGLTPFYEKEKYFNGRNLKNICNQLVKFVNENGSGILKEI